MIWDIYKHKNNIFLLISKVTVRSEPCNNIHENNNFILQRKSGNGINQILTREEFMIEKKIK